MPVDQSTQDKNISQGKKPKSEPMAQKVWRGQEQAEHHLFDLKPAICIRNDSYKMYQPIKREQNHNHKFHSIDRKGREQIYCSPNAGHFHEIKHEWDGDNLISVSCGPPLRIKWEKDRTNQMRRMKVRIVYVGKEPDGSKDIHDNHVHELKYMRSEKLRIGISQKVAPLGGSYMDKYDKKTLEEAQAVIKAK